MTEALIETHLPLANRRQGKVRDTYEMKYPDGEGGGVDGLVIVATDRISAFDVVMPNGVPGKGVVLNQISAFWFEMIEREFGDGMAHHVLDVPAHFELSGMSADEIEVLADRVTIGRRTKVIPIECVARGYLAGSGWKEYELSQTVCGVELPAGLKQCDKLASPIFTPATKAATGHDENIDFEKACEIAGGDVMEVLREKTLAIYEMAHDYALARGIIIADTKFEFGLPLEGGCVGGGDVILIDEVLSPDSSRFWPADRYESGRDQDSYDKQYVRNYLEELVSSGKWDKTSPGPMLPADVVAGTVAKYREAMAKLMEGD